MFVLRVLTHRETAFPEALFVFFAGSVFCAGTRMRRIGLNEGLMAEFLTVLADEGGIVSGVH